MCLLQAAPQSRRFTQFDQENTDQHKYIPNPGHKNKYALALGYSDDEITPHNNRLNIFMSDLSSINSSAFSKKMYTYFGTCRTGNKFSEKISFAQAWANKTGGLVKAATGTHNNNGRTDYSYIYDEPLDYKLWGWLGFETPRSRAREKYGFSASGCLDYPTVTDVGSFKKFYSQR